MAKPSLDERGHASDEAVKLLALVRALAVELRPQSAQLRVDLANRLDSDLGFDSLARTELMLRIERAFAVRVAERAFTEAETVRDLLVAIHGATPGASPAAVRSVAAALGPAEAAPASAETLIDVLAWHVAAHGERPHIWLVDPESSDTTLTYRTLAESAQAVARGLIGRGIEPGDRVGLMLPTSVEFFPAFFGILYAGATPVPIYPPVRPAQLADHMRRQSAILANAGAELLITIPEARSLALILRAQVESLTQIETVAALTAEPSAAMRPREVTRDDIALIQYTSGSTGDPKGVVLTHANLLANIRAMGEAIRIDPARDVFVSWLPLYHDMGLIGAWLGSLYFAMPVSITSPLTFLARPETWLWELHRRRGTLSGAPNFAYELCASRIDDAKLTGLDLSSVRMMVNGAEPVNPDTLRRFVERFSRYGFKPEALAPVFGLAESSVGLAFPPPGRPFVIDRIDRRALAERGEAVAAGPEVAAAIEVVGCGLALPRHEMHVVDTTGREVAERREGRLQFRGPSSTQGYYRNDARTRELFAGDGWVETGDRAYLWNGELFITGRVKDIVIRAGRNIYPQELEAAVGEVAGIRKGCVAVFGVRDAQTATEKLVIVAETRETVPDRRAALRAAIDATAADILGSPADDVVLAPPHAVLKTSSGKLRRSACRELYEKGTLAAPTKTVFRQLAGLAVASAVEFVRRGIRVAGAYAFAGYFWALVGLFVALGWPLVCVLPTLAGRWMALRGFGRTLLTLLGLRVTASGSAAVPASGAILVSNHGSYLDGLTVIATLPDPVVFVAKAEFRGQFFVGTLLRRLGARFVERFDLEQGAADASALIADARAGRRLYVFAEGTVNPRPGVLDFKLGAFATAAAAGARVVPVALKGPRSILGVEDWFPRRAAIAVTYLPALTPGGADFSAAVQLRDGARAAILAALGEPDLAGEVPRHLRAAAQR
jgi:1-acyl-sn-glycerol-3-phosphate acyltransferase